MSLWHPLETVAVYGLLYVVLMTVFGVLYARFRAAVRRADRAHRLAQANPISHVTLTTTPRGGVGPVPQQRAP